MVKQRKSKTDAEKMLLDLIRPDYPEVLSVIMRRGNASRWEFGFVRSGRALGKADHAARQVLLKLEEEFDIAGD